MAGVIVLDASVLIAYLDAEDVHHAAAEELLVRAIDDDLAANSLTLAEVFVRPAQDGRLNLVREVLGDLEVRELPFPVDSAVRLAQIRASTGLKMPDSCLLLTAEEAAASVASFDERLAQAAVDRGLTVVRP